MRRFFAAGVVVALSCVSGAAHAVVDKYAITPVEHAACDSDAERLCYASYPDEDKLLTCMKASFGVLSPRCQSVMKAGLTRRHMPL